MHGKREIIQSFQKGEHINIERIILGVIIIAVFGALSGSALIFQYSVWQIFCVGIIASLFMITNKKNIISIQPICQIRAKGSSMNNWRILPGAFEMIKTGVVK